MNDKALRRKVAQLAYDKPELRPHLLPLLKEAIWQNQGRISDAAYDMTMVLKDVFERVPSVDSSVSGRNHISGFMRHGREVIPLYLTLDSSRTLLILRIHTEDAWRPEVFIGEFYLEIPVADPEKGTYDFKAMKDKLLDAIDLKTINAARWKG